MKEIVINHLFEKDYGVIDLNNHENCLYVGSFDSCVGYLEDYKRQEREHRERFQKLLINSLELK